MFLLLNYLEVMKVEKSRSLKVKIDYKVVCICESAHAGGGSLVSLRSVSWAALYRSCPSPAVVLIQVNPIS